jgi:hypothetical protein
MSALLAFPFVGEAPTTAMLAGASRRLRAVVVTRTRRWRVPAPRHRPAATARRPTTAAPAPGPRGRRARLLPPRRRPWRRRPGASGDVPPGADGRTAAVGGRVRAGRGIARRYADHQRALDGGTGERGQQVVAVDALGISRSRDGHQQEAVRGPPGQAARGGAAVWVGRRSLRRATARRDARSAGRAS